MKNNCPIKGIRSFNAQGEEINYQQEIQGGGNYDRQNQQEQMVNQIGNRNQIDNQDERGDDISININ